MFRTFHDLVQALHEHPEWREELRRLVLTQELLTLPQLVREIGEQLRLSAEAQRRTDERLEQLTARVDQLTARVDQLTARVDQLTARVDQLAEAQRRTEETLRGLVVDMQEVKKQLGGLADSVGYGLEDRAFRHLPRLLAERFQLRLKGRLQRKFFLVGERQVEVNLWGLAQRPDGRLVRILGEAKAQLSWEKHFKQVERALELTRPFWEAEEVLVVLLSYLALPGTYEEAQRRGWCLIESWELEPEPVF